MASHFSAGHTSDATPVRHDYTQFEDTKHSVTVCGLVAEYDPAQDTCPDLTFTRPETPHCKACSSKTIQRGHVRRRW